MDHAESVPQITPQEAQARLAAGALLIDVREARERARVRIPGAVSRPMSEINEWWQQLPDDRELIFQCRSGARSDRVAEALISQAGLTNVFNLAGGLISWAEAGFALER